MGWSERLSLSTIAAIEAAHHARARKILCAVRPRCLMLLVPADIDSGVVDGQANPHIRLPYQECR
jgi:hypothetical protein